MHSIMFSFSDIESTLCFTSVFDVVMFKDVRVMISMKKSKDHIIHLHTQYTEAISLLLAQK